MLSINNLANKKSTANNTKQIVILSSSTNTLFKDHREGQMSSITANGVEEAPYKCLLCPESFLSPLQQYAHFRRFHISEFCLHCDVLILKTKPHAYRTHRREAHPEMCLQCSHCKSSFPCLKGFRSHLLVIHKELSENKRYEAKVLAELEICMEYGLK